MARYEVTRFHLVAWARDHEVGRAAWQEFDQGEQDIDRFFDDNLPCKGLVETIADNLGYPGDGNWTPSAPEDD